MCLVPKLKFTSLTKKNGKPIISSMWKPIRSNFPYYVRFVSCILNKSVIPKTSKITYQGNETIYLTNLLRKQLAMDASNLLT